MYVNRGFLVIGLVISVLYLPLSGFSDMTEKNIEELFFIPSPTGYENMFSERIMQQIPDSDAVSRSLLGSVYFSKDGNLPHISVLCGMDEVGYIVGGIDAQGTITLDRVVPAPHPLFDSFFPGHAMEVWTENGAVKGVLAIPSLHIFPRRERENFAEYFTLEKMRLDIGASRREQVLEKGIRNGSPVTPGKKIGYLQDGKIAGYFIGQKACAAVLVKTAEKVLAEENIGKVTLGWLAQTRMVSRGSSPRACVGGVRAEKSLASFENIIIDVFPTDGLQNEGIHIGGGPVLIGKGKEVSKLNRLILKSAENRDIKIQTAGGYESLIMNAFSCSEKDFAGLFLPAQFAYTPSEVIDFNDIKALEKLVMVVLAERRKR